MRALRGVQLRAIALPLSAALASVIGLTWYRFLWIPGQETYLNERNLRVLQMTATLIKKKIDGFDLTIDHANESVKAAEDLGRYVTLLASDLEILSGEESDVAKKLLGRPSDPPTVAIQRDEGRNFLYLGYERGAKGTQSLYARADIERVVAPFLSVRPEFETVLLVDGKGEVIFQPPARGFAIARLSQLSETGKPVEANASKPEAGLTFETLRRTSIGVVDVTFGATLYKLYLQPVQLSLTTKDVTTKDGTLDRQAEWTLCGLVRADRFRAASSALVTTYWLWFGLLLASVLVAIPLVKLRLLSPRERLRSTDGVAVAVVGFLIIGLGGVALLDAWRFGWRFAADVDDGLTGVATKLVQNFELEEERISAQMDKFDLREKSGGEIWRQLYRGDKPPPPREDRVHRIDPDPDQVKDALGVEMEMAGGQHCHRLEACRDALLLNLCPPDDPRSNYCLPSDALPYPYFKLVIWNDDEGWQRIKWSTTDVTPFLNLQKEKNLYYDDMSRARQMVADSDDDDKKAGTGLAFDSSPNTGELLTVFWRAVKDPGRKLEDGQRGIAGVALAATPLSLVDAVLPKGTQFVVLDADGAVLHHSDPARSSRLNFFEDCGNDARLQAGVRGEQRDAFDAQCFGRRHRLFLRPLVDSHASFANPRRWMLVVYQETALAETLNLETLILAGVLFGLYALVLVIVWGVLYLWWPNEIGKWFWPNRESGANYNALVMLNLVLAAACVVAVGALSSSFDRLLVAVLGAIASLVVSFAVVRNRRWSCRRIIEWPADFLCARSSVLFLVAAVPAIACFLAAYDFETALFVRWREVALRNDLVARDGRIAQQAQRIPLCGRDLRAATRCSRSDAYMHERGRETMDLHVDDKVLERAISGASDQGDSENAGLTSFLRHLHLPYNEFTAGLLVEPLDKPLGNAKLDLPSSPAVLTSWYWLIVAGLMVSAYLVVRYLQKPLFAMDGRQLPPAPEDRLDGNVLVVGPPGSGTSEWMLEHAPRAAIIDVRALTVPKLQPAAASTPAGGVMPAVSESVPPSFWWRDVVAELPIAGRGLACINHLEHRFNEAAFREQVLTLIEALLYRGKHTVWIASARDPIDALKDARRSRTADSTLDRWVSLLESFHVKRLPLVAGTRHDEHSYEALWTSCSTAERLALRQLAEEELVNPNNLIVIGRLRSAGLVQYDSSFKVMSERFRRFILQAASPAEVSLWEREGVRLPWGSIATTMATVALGLGGLLLLTQEQLVDAWVAYIPTLAPTVPSVLKLFAGVSRAGKSDTLRA